MGSLSRHFIVLVNLHLSNARFTLKKHLCLIAQLARGKNNAPIHYKSDRRQFGLPHIKVVGRLLVVSVKRVSRKSRVFC